MLQDIRHGLRVLFKNPGFALIAIITLALGIGANAAIFSVVYGVLLRPLPYQDGGRLVVLHQQAPKANAPDVPFSAQEIFDYRDHSHTLQSVVEHHSMSFLLYTNDSAERVATAVVSANFFDVLGVRPLLGRTFVAADEAHGSDAVLILSYEYWKNRHGADPNVVGKIFQMNNRPHTVIGVLPSIPQYPIANDVYMPTSQCPFRSSPKTIQDRTARLMTAFGRLKPGVPVEQAQADLTALAHQIEQAHPEAYPKAEGYGLAVAPLRDDLTRRARTTFFVLLGAAGFVLLIACANVANLLLARLLKIERELSIRIALGANRGRLVRQLLTESVILSLAGGLLGLAIAPSALAVLVKFAQQFTTRAGEVKIDTPVLLFTLGVSLLTGILFGLAPAFSTSANVSDAMKSGSGRTTSGRGRQRLRGGLVVAQVAVSFMLVMGAGLMIKSFLALQNQNPGFNAEHVLAMRTSASPNKYKTQTDFRTLYDSLLRRVQSVSGIESAAFSSTFPFNPGSLANGPNTIAFEIEGRTVSQGDLAPQVDAINITPDYFRAIRQPLLSGRQFTDHDDATATKVVIINQSMARRRWANEDPIGKRVRFNPQNGWLQIIGVVGDAKEYGLDKPVDDEVYLPTAQNGNAGNLVVRAVGDPMGVASAVRDAIRSIDSQIAVDRLNSIERFRSDSVASPRVTAILLGLFAGLAMLISACGIAAVMALSVRQRTNELGIRMALGASRDSIVMMVMRQGLTLVIAGTVIGLAGAIALTRLMASLLYATSPTDVMTFAAVSALFVGVAAVACFIPARQVTSIDPLNALRQD
jgi:putative ABC transport system permease protein